MVSLALDSKQLAETYDRVGERQFNHGKLLLEALKIREGEHLLDVGCGTGRLAAHAAALVGPSGKVLAIDPLPLRVALARKKAPQNLTATVGAAEDLSQFADHSFDAVFLNSVFHWLPDKLTPLREALRVLKPGGRIGISTAAADRPHDIELVLGQVFASSDLADVQQVPTGALHQVSSSELRRLLAEAGFEAIAVEIRSFVDHFDDTEAVVAFNEASSFGNFLSSLLSEQRALAHSLLDVELEKRRDAQGIALQRNLSFALAKRAR
jgi:ubiquinone/menaquinone biosynthesis C-methylase UbiE